VLLAVDLAALGSSVEGGASGSGVPLYWAFGCPSLTGDWYMTSPQARQRLTPSAVALFG
jgi:hypothetical protein